MQMHTVIMQRNADYGECIQIRQCGEVHVLYGLYNIYDNEDSCDSRVIIQYFSGIIALLHIDGCQYPYDDADYTCQIYDMHWI